MSTLTAQRPAVQAPMAPVAPVPHYRLTRRGRLAVLLVGLFTVLAIGVAFAGMSLANGEPAPTDVVVVEPGDTLWDISSELGDGDVRSMMRTITELNSLDTVALAVGQRLRVPAEQ